MSDDTVTTIDEVRARLARDPRIVHPDEIAVSIRNKIATLRGSVGTFHHRWAAIQVTKAAPGISAVVDEILVDPRDRWQDNELRGAALRALISSEDVPDDRIDARVADGWLTLRGEVKHQHESDAAFTAVSGLPGVGGITNRIVVITAGIAG